MANNFSDKENAEYQIERCLQSLRSSDRSSPYLRNKWRKTIVDEMFFLKEEHPESYIFEMDISDISLELE